MFDFKQIESGEDFELLCEDLLREMGYTIEASVSRGPDLGRDIIVSKTVTDETGFTESYRYLIECKHYARSDKSVQEADIGSPIARMGTHNCNRYILITSTVPSEKVRAQLAAVPNAVPGYKANVWAKNDLARFLEQHPEVWERHVGLTRITGTPVRLLASEVETWLQAMGYALSGKQLRDDDQVEMVAEMDKGTIRQRLLIRCLDGEADVERVEALAEAARGQGFAEGWAIADRRVASSARKLAEENTVLRVFNLAEFMRLTFGPYFDALTKLVEESHIPEYYVNLGCCAIVTDAEGREIRRERHATIDDYIDDWLKERGKMHISILGEFGTGKTWFCRHYAYRRLARYLADPVHERLPLLITLRDFAKATTAQQLINDALLERYKLPLVGSAFEVFARMNRQGKLLLILDGFDEMARKVDYQTVVDNFWELANVVVEGSKVLLTSRTEYFRYAQESEKVLRGEEYRRATIELTPPKFEVLYLEPFSDAQIEEVIVRRVGAEEGPVVARRILDTPNLAELARKPVLIELLLAALDEAGGEALRSPAQVYLYATNALLLRNIETERTFTSTADKLFFLCELAWEMIREDNLRIHYKQIPQRIRTWFGEKVAEEELDHWDYDLRNQTLLQRTAAGEYEFAHKSLAEYFVACRFGGRVGCLPPQFGRTYGVDRLTGRADTVAEVRAAATGGLLSPAIREFVADVLNMPDVPRAPREKLLAALRATITDAALPPRARADAGLLLGLLGWLPSDLDEMLPVSKSLAVARYPVTNAQFARFIAAGGYENDAWWSAEGRRWRDKPSGYRGQGPLRRPEYWGDPRFNNPLQPVVGVMWYEAEAYARWLSATSGREVRLLTEDEWLLAAQGPALSSEYPWGTGFDPAKANTSESKLGQPTAVGTYLHGASPCGALDMAGNVWEWTASWYDEKKTSRVLRGGSWDGSEYDARCSGRSRYSPYLSDLDLGFRLVSPVLS